jgi:hypothetical protein
VKKILKDTAKQAKEDFKATIGKGKGNKKGEFLDVKNGKGKKRQLPNSKGNKKNALEADSSRRNLKQKNADMTNDYDDSFSSSSSARENENSADFELESSTKSSKIPVKIS